MPVKLASNAVVASVTEAAARYGVPYYRQQSRVFTVTGAGGRQRPMFVGEWTDRLGVIHRKGIADLLLTPEVDVLRLNCSKLFADAIPPGLSIKVQVPLWVECKFGTGKLEADQKHFRECVLAGGGFYIHAHDCADQVLQWFQQMGVRR